MKSSRPVVHLSIPAAVDLNGEVTYLAEASGEAISLRFLHAVEQTLSLIADFPQTGTTCSSRVLTTANTRHRTFFSLAHLLQRHTRPH